ncbi:uncharacterized protein LOC119088072 [Peromyscus leucopus]|uniref:uncharacterized protein LOC119088072 n=1 Tax=Peromyscus leucopus TaxID=10041 RepID=UPI001885711B|nr:uncharacterized protein LOC119088072 [Peromyscus leucopus]
MLSTKITVYLSAPWALGEGEVIRCFGGPMGAVLQALAGLPGGLPLVRSSVLVTAWWLGGPGAQQVCSWHRAPQPGTDTCGKSWHWGFRGRAVALGPTDGVALPRLRGGGMQKNRSFSGPLACFPFRLTTSSVQAASISLSPHRPRSEGAPAAAAPACVSRVKSPSDREDERAAEKLEGGSLGLQTPSYLLGEQFAKPVRQKASPSATDAAKGDAARRRVPG